jgi:hypothetical protein
MVLPSISADASDQHGSGTGFSCANLLDEYPSSMRNSRFFGSLVFALWFWACGGGDDGGVGTNAFGGASAASRNSGDTSSSGSGTSAPGNSSSPMGGSSNSELAASGGKSAGGDPSSAIGGASSTNDSSGVDPRWNDGVTAGCALWPKGKLMPKVGPFFYGPDPGPCRMGTPGNFLESATYTYDANGHLQTFGNFGRQVRYEFQEDQMVSFTIGGTDAVDGKVSYEAGSVLIRRDLQDARFELDPRGYPRRATYDDNHDGTPDWGRIYQYENCQLKRVVFDSDLPAPPAEFSVSNSTYEYDSEGHVSVIRSDTGSSEAFDYACWK